MRTTIDGALFRRMVISGAAALENDKQPINDLNVFPVPDGDTGTNMSMTLNAAVKDLRNADDPTLTKAADIASSATLRGARGNSGVILSLLFRGFSKAWKNQEKADGVLLADALRAGVDAAYHAIMKPTEGTILTVSRLAAEAAASAAEEQNCFEHVLNVAIDAAEAALNATTDQNPVLKKAGVVDAGGKGYLCILEGMRSSMLGNDITVVVTSETETNDAANFAEFSGEDILFAYCTEFIVSRENDRDPALLLEYLMSDIGDSVVMVPDDTIIKVHIHTNEPGNVLTQALMYGSLLTVKIENMREQHTEKVMHESERKIAEPEKTFGVVAVCAGKGLVDAFRDLGVDQIVEGGQTMNPSTDDILSAVNATPSEIVYVLPNNKNIILAAEQTIPLTEKRVIVIPTKTVPQGITAMLSFDPSQEEEVLTENLKGSFGDVTTMQITYAARNSDFDGHDIKAGEYLGLYNGALFASNKDVNKILAAMAEKVQEDDKEFISIFYGADISEKDANSALHIFEKNCPDAEVSLLHGGQPVYYYLISAE